MTVDGANREEAVSKMKEMMDETKIAEHMKSKHPGEPVMSVADCHAMIEKELIAA